MIRTVLGALGTVILLAACRSAPPVSEVLAAEPGRVAQGLELTIWAEEVADARSLALGPEGHVFVGNRKGNRVVALRDADGDGRAEERQLVAKELDMPNGVAVLGDDLYIATHQAVWIYPGRARDPAADTPPRKLRSLPDERHHGWRYLAAGPDKRLYLSIGAPCNVCEREGFATIERFAPDGSEVEVIARGVRNSVGFDWDGEGRFWFTDNGRDWLGDDSPPCELNRLDEEGAHFGFPHCHGGDLVDLEFGEPGCASFVAPAWKLDAHVAPLGLEYYQGQALPPAYRGGFFVAEHGSWNRSSKAGYRLMFAALEGDRVKSYTPVVDVWLDGEEVSGRPVDLLTLPDGSVLISDDYAGRIWRLTAAKAR